MVSPTDEGLRSTFMPLRCVDCVVSMNYFALRLLPASFGALPSLMLALFLRRIYSNQMME